jgi:chromosome segregation ATPase
LIDSNDLVAELQEQLRVSETQQRRVAHSLENEKFTRQQAEGEAKRLAEQLDTYQSQMQAENSALKDELNHLTAALEDAQQSASIEIDRERIGNQEILDETIRYHEQRYTEIEQMLNHERSELRGELEGERDEELGRMQEDFEERLREASEDFEERLEEQARDHRVSLDEAQAREEDLEVQLSDLRRTIDSSDQQTKQSITELNEFRAEKSRLDRELEKLQVNFDQEVNRHFDTQQEFDEHRQKSADLQSKLDGQIQTLTEESAQRAGNIDDLNTQIQSLNDTIAGK